MVDVYLDAVFFPKCVEDFQTFQQEGWHYELNDPSEDITYKGCPFSVFYFSKSSLFDLTYLPNLIFFFLPVVLNDPLPFMESQVYWS